MLHKEFWSALAMTVIIIPFGIYVQELEDSSRTFPEMMLVCMLFFNALQYILAVLRRGIKLPDVQSGEYHLGRVLLLFGLTVVYILCLQDVGFYAASLVYFVAASLTAQPDPVTMKGVGMRTLWCSIFVGFLYMLFTVSLGVQIPKGFTGI